MASWVGRVVNVKVMWGWDKMLEVEGKDEGKAGKGVIGIGSGVFGRGVMKEKGVWMGLEGWNGIKYI